MKPFAKIPLCLLALSSLASCSPSSALSSAISSEAPISISSATEVPVSSSSANEESSSSSTENVVHVSGVRLNQNYLTLEVGESMQLSYSISPANATNQRVWWSSTDPTAVSVSSSGSIKALKGGSSVIAVQTEDGGYADYCQITVNEPVSSSSSSLTPSSSSEPSSAESSESSSEETSIAVAGIKLNKTKLALKKGNSERLIATVLPQNASEKGLIWSSSDESIATVGADGTVTGVEEGDATISVRTVEGDYAASCEVFIAYGEGCYYSSSTTFDIVDSKGGHTKAEYIRLVTLVKNVGTVNMYLSSCTYDVLTEEGEPIQSISEYDVKESPYIVEPGELGIFSAVVSLEQARTDLTVTDHITIKNARSYESVRYDISNVTFGEDSLFHRLVVKGKVTNNTNKTASTLDQIVFVLLDEDYNYLSTYVDALPVALKPGESCVFEANNLMYGFLDIKKEDVAHYLGYAFAYEYVF